MTIISSQISENKTTHYINYHALIWCKKNERMNGWWVNRYFWTRGVDGEELHGNKFALYLNN